MPRQGRRPCLPDLVGEPVGVPVVAGPGVLLAQQVEVPLVPQQPRPEIVRQPTGRDVRLDLVEDVVEDQYHAVGRQHRMRPAEPNHALGPGRS